MQNRKRIYSFTPVKQIVFKNQVFWDVMCPRGSISPMTQHHIPQLKLQRHLHEYLVSCKI